MAIFRPLSPLSGIGVTGPKFKIISIYDDSIVAIDINDDDANATLVMSVLLPMYSVTILPILPIMQSLFATDQSFDKTRYRHDKIYSVYHANITP